jgi:ABC-type polysaccharide/polyol phosphate export permease
LLTILLQDVRQRYAGTTAGLLWVVAYPTALIALYTVVYLYVLRIQPPGVEAPVYVLRIVSGLVVVIGFSEALTAGTGSRSTPSFPLSSFLCALCSLLRPRR